MRRKEKEKEKNSTDDLKKMITSFRIAELQTLLASCGRSRCGRKHELYGRAKSLLKSTFNTAMWEKVKSKILELYYQRVLTGAAPPINDNDNTPVTINPASIATPFLHTQPYMSYPNDEDLQPTDKPRYMLQSNYRKKRSEPYEPSVHSSIAMPIHPDVRFISLPFYDLVDVLIKPTGLQTKSMMGYQETNLVFHLTPYQTHFIANSRSYHINSMIESAVQVQLRFCLNETSCVQEDLYPTRCKIVVNGKGTPLPGQPPPNSQNMEPRKPHRPVNITSFCHLSPMQSNQIQVQWLPSELGQSYTATVHLIKAVQADTLIQKLANKTIRSKEYTIGFIKVKLSPDPDSEVAMTSLKVSLCCPIGRTRMTMPCRTNNCKHLQCFDGSTYIQMNERKPSWVCPICDQKAYYEDLFQDGLFTSIITEATNCEDIVFFEDGSWRPLEDFQQEQDGSKPPAEVINTPKSSNKPQSIIGRDSPPVLSISPEISAIPNLPSPSASNIRPMPTLELRPTIQGDLNINDEQSQTPEEDDIEIIMIDDSDSDSEDTVPINTYNSSDIVNSGQRFNSAEAGITTDLTIPFSDTDLQDLELYDPDLEGLYNLIPSDDEMLNQSSNVNNSQQSPVNNVIDISDISDE